MSSGRLSRNKNRTPAMSFLPSGLFQSTVSQTICAVQSALSSLPKLFCGEILPTRGSRLHE